MHISAREAATRRQCTMRELYEAVIHEGLTPYDRNGFQLVNGQDPITRTFETAAYKCNEGKKTATQVSDSTAIITEYTFSHYSFTITRDLHERTLSANCDNDISFAFFGGPFSEKVRVDWLNDVYFDEHDISRPVHELIEKCFGEHGEHIEPPQITSAYDTDTTKSAGPVVAVTQNIATPKKGKEHKFSQRKAAFMLGVSEREVQYWESGTRTPKGYSKELRKNPLAFTHFAGIYRGEKEALEIISCYNPAGGGKHVSGDNSDISRIMNAKKEPSMCSCGAVGEMKDIGGVWQCGSCNAVKHM